MRQRMHAREMAHDKESYFTGIVSMEPEFVYAKRTGPTETCLSI